jgi:alpha-mannosidase
MSVLDMKLTEIRKQCSGYWSDRIFAQLEYALKLSKTEHHQHDAVIGKALNYLSDQLAKNEAITKETAIQAEYMISVLSGVAKRYKMICAAHAHIDMNWMWGWDETVAVTLDTFRTMLDLFEEYPDFNFSQSQASIYKIVEQYAPDMLETIKKRVKEGRWEVTASTWVEADKNMPNGESLARHILYTKRYLADLLDIDPETLNLDFEPDTFGHSVHVPEILANGGIRYYYHCRGYDGHHLYKWVSPSGSSVTVYREPIWYNAEIHPSMALYVPEFCQKHNLDTMLKVYGVGDHGGGPTRRDLERIIDMMTWPVFPEIKFGTFGDFYQIVEQSAAQLPVVTGELNFVFTGCYTSQSRIKKANRFGEAALNEAEAFSTVSALGGGSYKYPYSTLTGAWENVLFNQFHDIIPGSGVTETREHAMGLFQNTMAAANSSRSRAMQNIAAQIDTSALASEDHNAVGTVSEGAGAGFGSKDYKISHSERGRGKTRIFHIFNSSTHDRSEAAELTIWDWQGSAADILFKDSEGNKVEHQLLDHGFNHYWGHHYIRALIRATVPALGYSTYVMTENDYEIPTPFPLDPRVEKSDQFVLENDKLRVVFDPHDASIRSLFDKTNGEELADTNRPCGVFRFIEEDTDKGMTAWIVGRYMNVTNLTKDVKIRNVRYDQTDVRQSISYDIEFLNSRLKVSVSLDYNSPFIDFDVECDWHEIGKADKSIPQLSFHMPFAYESSAYKYDVPFGTVERTPLPMDVPANSWAAALRDSKSGNCLMLITDSKYGFRGVDNALNVTLLRSSYDPDPYPELGIHKFRFAVGLVNAQSNKNMIDTAYDYNHALSIVSDKAHPGTLPLNKSFVRLEQGSVAISGIKKSEDANNADEIILRVYETEGNRTEAVIRFDRDVKKAVFVDMNENEIDTELKPETKGSSLTFEVMPFRTAALRISL